MSLAVVARGRGAVEAENETGRYRIEPRDEPTGGSAGQGVGADF
ncbi:hypothetical protein [Haloferax chudinovii]|uniref:Uncharacterized protein n=1 Tax=Haloferax chudinovii TaxID=1109010 RepID=A0ABD5XBD0_9EURY